MFGFLKKQSAVSLSSDGGAASHGGKKSSLESSLSVSVALWLLIICLLQWMVDYGGATATTTVWGDVTKSFMLFSLTLALVPMYRLCVGPLFRKNKSLLVTWCAILLQIACFVLVRHVTTNSADDVGHELCFLPYILAPLVVSVLQGPLQGMFCTVAMSMLGIFYIFPAEWQAESLFHYWTVSSLSGMLTVLLAHNLRSRIQILKTGFFCGLLVLVLCGILGDIDLKLLGNFDMDKWAPQFTVVIKELLGAFGVSLLVCVVVSGGMPFLENISKIILPISWLEMADMNRPLMKRLQMEAPGTFHHCLMVAQLAEAAAEEIDANAEECRVMSYYHDIGKLEEPLYFTENVQDGPSPHEGLSAASSARKIIDHVQNGLALAKKHKLPRPLEAVIEQHHGTSLAYFFYRKALQNREDLLKKVEIGLASPDDVPEVVESNFRYKGPNPQSREVAIVSLADIVESATRSMGKLTPDVLLAKVNELIKQRVVEGHLDDCGLTFGELKKVRDSFVNTLKSSQHNRIAYPSRESEPDKKPTENKAEDDAQLKLPLEDATQKYPAASVSVSAEGDAPAESDPTGKSEPDAEAK